MEYVIYKDKDELITLDDEDTITLNGFGEYNRYQALELPDHPCDLELFRDTLHEVLTKVIEEKRKRDE